MREKLASRLGFLMVAAGCAVGLGNVWRFPYIVGKNGGAAFVLAYLFFLAVLGFPLAVAELAIGRGSGSGIPLALQKLAPPRLSKIWAALGWIMFAGQFILMIYYTDVAGWLVRYTANYATGSAPTSAFADAFNSCLADRGGCAAYMLGVVALCTATCFVGVVKGVERVTKFFMIALLALLIILAAKALTLPGAAEGVKFYLLPDMGKFLANPWSVAFDAMGQAFFTLSLGIGCMTIFGSYVEKRHSLAKEALLIIAIDTFVAFLSGLIIFPACFTYGVEPSSGPGLIFIAIPEVLAKMPGGHAWGAMFFLFLSLAAITTVITVFEAIIGGMTDESRLSRRLVAPVVGLSVGIASLPCVLFDSVLKWEDFAVSQLWLPLGALAQCAFVTLPIGWGWMKFREEASKGDGLNVPNAMRWHMTTIIPLLTLTVLAVGAWQTVFR